MVVPAAGLKVHSLVISTASPEVQFALTTIPVRSSVSPAVYDVFVGAVVTSMFLIRATPPPPPPAPIKIPCAIKMPP